LTSAPGSPVYNPYEYDVDQVYRLEDHAFLRHIGDGSLEPDQNAWTIPRNNDDDEKVEITNAYLTDIKDTVSRKKLHRKTYVYVHDKDNDRVKWDLLLNDKGSLVLSNSKINKYIPMPHQSCYETTDTCKYAYKSGTHKMVECKITGFTPNLNCAIELLTPDDNARFKKGRLASIEAGDLIKLAGYIVNIKNDQKQYVIDTSHRSVLLPTLIDAVGGSLHTGDLSTLIHRGY
jgi:hypothetical protein